MYIYILKEPRIGRTKGIGEKQTTRTTAAAKKFS